MKKMKRIIVFSVAVALWIAGFALTQADLFIIVNGWNAGEFLPLLPFIASYLLVGFPVLRNAIRNLMDGNALDENFLMTIATIGAFAIREWEEAAGVMIFYTVGELIQDRAVDKSRASIEALLALKPDTARVKRGDNWEEVPAESVSAGALVMARAGERIPLDGIIEEGEGFIDASMLSGESKPVSVKAGGEVHSGAVSLDGVLIIRSTKSAENSSAAKIIRLIEQARENKAKPERFITVFARYYTPAVVGAAFLLAVIPPLLLNDPFSDWFKRALTLLVISCPCALVVSIPLGYFAGIGGLSRRGVMVKGASCLDALAKTEYAAFDKTGTLTKGEFSVQKIETAEGVSETLLLQTAALAERHSNHPIAKALMKAVSARNIEISGKSEKEKIRERAGRGLELNSEAGNILAGNKKLLEEHGAFVPEDDSNGTAVYIAKDGAYLGRILIGDAVKEGAARAIAELKRLGVKKTLMFTGDSAESAVSVAELLGVDETSAGLLPEDKLSALEKWTTRGLTIFVGDGVNDAPVLARADVGVSMGAGADIAVETADIIIMNSEPDRVPEAIFRARKIRRVITQNVIFALTAKIFCITLAVAGLANMWLALFADVGVALIAIFNAVRTLK
jgi:Cd2+/Zn2+-exporting ATPase